MKTAMIVFGVMLIMLAMLRWNRSQIAKLHQGRRRLANPVTPRPLKRTSDEHGSTVKWIVDRDAGDRPRGPEPPPE